MKIVVLKTYTDDTRIYWATLPPLGHEVIPLQYDHLPHDRHSEVITATSELKPDLLIFIGAVESSHGRPILRLDSLKKLADVAPMIHMCGDAGDEPWWDMLIEYDRAGCFVAQVSIDGNFNTPINDFKNGIIKLCPVDPREFTNRQTWTDRKHFIGLTGNAGHGRRGEMMRYVSGLPETTWIQNVSYHDYANFMCNCKVIVNCPMRGSAQGDHVKARVVETGWAGACLLEAGNTHTARWFTPGVEYLEYAHFDEIRMLVHMKDSIDLRYLAMRFHEKVSKEHNPQKFWNDVFSKAAKNMMTDPRILEIPA